MTAWTCRGRPSRSSPISTVSPTRSSPTALRTSAGTITVAWLSETMTSPLWMPACSAGEPSSTCVTSAPSRTAQAQRLRDVGTDRVGVDAEQAALHGAELLQLVGDAADHVDRDGEADADIAAGAGQDGRGEADQFAAQVDQRAAGVARIDGGVGLDEILEAVLVEIAAAQAADDAGGHRIAQPERIADGDHKVADFELRGVAQGDLRELDRAHFEHGDVRGLIDPDDFGLQVATIGQRHGDFAGVLDHMRVGENVALARIEDHAGAGALELRRVPAARLGHIEEAIEGRIREQRICRDCSR